MTAGLPEAPLAAAAGDADTAARLLSAGVDVLIAYHSSVLRRRGLPSVAGLLPWANANELTLGVLPSIAGSGTLFATVCANDPLRPASQVLARLVDLGVAGVLNAPTVGLLTGPVRAAVERAGLGFDREVELMALAARHGLRAWGYAFTPAQATALVDHGAEAVVVHLGITGAGSPTARCAATLTTVADAARATNADVRVLAHGGPLTDPGTFAELCRSLDVHCGFFGASVFECAEDVEAAVHAWRTVLTRKVAG
ncbi:phosphoenolpyruvate hydrolase family protein [Allokutzneria albata]|uniref:Predicted TIM-barrel enzyme n=1 Tax=Allokutzneria albata TaxID=211114 RepID=A0A1G9SWN2_ALLAB|nr:phosphoenolpyruvate hydrolase family protein [Allokutzneria albata]SDM39794.1 Predicted TIM-barrel enzyme [Allokutzneria albata]